MNSLWHLWRAVTAGTLIVSHLLGAEVTPLISSHSHNDYRQNRPLFDALDRGFTGVEADIFLIDGQLRVGHDRKEAAGGKTLQELYLQPLKARAQENAGRIYRNGPLFFLLIDIKADARQLYPILRTNLISYHEILTRFSGDQVETNAITVILSGDRPIDLVAAESERWWALDGRLPDLERHPSPPISLFPWISDSWRPSLSWIDGPEWREADRTKLRTWVNHAHQQGRQIRFWGAPENPFGWEELLQAGVDRINSDRLPELSQYLRASPDKRASLRKAATNPTEKD